MIVDEQVLRLHESIVSALTDFAKERGYSKVANILERGDENLIHLINSTEGAEVGMLTGAYKDDVELRYPYHAEEMPYYNCEHDDKFDFANVVVVIKVAFELMRVYPSRFSPEASE